MSLRIWLPLNGSLENKGLDDIVITNNGATIDNNGKIGKCYSFDGNDDYISLNGNALYNIIKGGSNPFSFTMWIFHADNSRAILFGDYSLSGSINFNIELNASHSVRFYWGGAPDTSGNHTLVTQSGWTHIAIVYNGTDIKFYKNGTLTDTYVGTLTIKNKNSGDYYLGRDTRTGTTALNGKMNDFRIYDHALSPLEIKEISKGLILHYLLNRNGLGPTNLLKNGFGELGIENWGYAGGMFSDVPENHPEIYHSYKNVESKEFIPIYRNHNYKFSTWIKTTASSGNSYPSICPYDVDKLLIATNHCKEGFDLKTMTVLTRELKAGDTKIYVEDLSKWNANSGHYYDTAAIFSYKDGTGYIWPDGVYTRNCPAFSSGTEAKTNLDKTNNIITLLTAYNGVTIPVGTKVCASAYGNTYFYPCGGIPYSTITNWTFKENTFSSETPRLSAAKYIRVLAYSNCYQAGITVTDLTVESFNNNIEYDCSGFCNNGTRIGTFTWISDTPKYNVSTSFDGSVKIERDSLIGEVYTLSCWAKTTKNKSTSQMMVVDSNSQMAIAFYNGTIIGVYGTTRSTGSKCTLSGSNYKENEWNHFVVVKTSNDGKRNIYCNGELLTPSSDDYWSSTPNNFVIGARNTSTPYYFYGEISDVRVYATALSAEDVKSLYNNSAYIDNQGNIYGAVYEEV